jgi:hypothetical protein
MRPVTITRAVPPNYSEADQLNVLAYSVRGPKAAYYAGLTKAQIVADLARLIGTWVSSANRELNHGKPQFGTADTILYDEQMDMLQNGDHDWGDARKELIEAIGAYCSYCESPIFSHLHIEHRLPKSMFPEDAFSWSNFLLSCSTCNSAKGNDPNQATISKKIANVPELPRPTDTAAARNCVTNNGSTNYLWPNGYNWATLPAFSRYAYKYQLKWLNHFRDRLVFDLDVSAREETELLDKFKAGGLSIERGLYSDGGRRVAVQVVCNLGADATLRNAAERVIELMSLNKVVASSDSSKSVDRRQFNRTTAWFRAKMVRQQLDEAYTSTGKTYLYPAVAEQIKTTIKNTGFWGVWLQVFGNIDVNGQPFQTLLRGCFPGTSTVTWLV